MRVTPAEAHQLWCPHARVAISASVITELGGQSNNWIPKHGEGVVAANRYPVGTPAMNTTCLAEKCMAWRWVDKKRGMCGLSGPQFIP